MYQVFEQIEKIIILKINLYAFSAPLSVLSSNGD